MDLHHALALLLVLVPLTVTANSTAKTIDTYFRLNFCIGDKFEDFGIDLTFNTTSLDFHRQAMTFFLAGACDMSEIRHGFVDHSRRYISYEARNKNWVPFNHSSKPYYNCKRRTLQTRMSRAVASSHDVPQSGDSQLIMWRKYDMK